MLPLKTCSIMHGVMTSSWQSASVETGGAAYSGFTLQRLIAAAPTLCLKLLGVDLETYCGRHPHTQGARQRPARSVCLGLHCVQELDVSNHLPSEITARVESQ